MASSALGAPEEEPTKPERREGEAPEAHGQRPFEPGRALALARLVAPQNPYEIDVLHLLLDLGARVGRTRPCVGPTSKAVREDRQTLAPVKANPAPRREDDHDAESLLHVVPADQEEHQLDHHPEHERRLRRDRPRRPGGEGHRNDGPGQDVPNLLKRLRLAAERAGHAISVEQEVRHREMRVVDDVGRMEHQEPRRELGRVEPDAPSEHEGQREEQRRRTSDEEKLAPGARPCAGPPSPARRRVRDVLDGDHSLQREYRDRVVPDALRAHSMVAPNQASAIAYNVSSLAALPSGTPLAAPNV